MGVLNCLGKENKNTMHIIYKKWKDKFQNRERQDANNMRIWVVTSNINILFIRLTYPCVSTKKKLALVIISKNFVFVFGFSFNHLNLLQKNILTYILNFDDMGQLWLSMLWSMTIKTYWVKIWLKKMTELELSMMKYEHECLARRWKIWWP